MTRLEVHRQLYVQQQQRVMMAIDAAKKEYYSNTCATATPTEAQKCLKDLLYSAERRLPPHDSEQELADSFVQLFRSKVANIRTALDRLQDQLPSLPDAPLVSVPELDSFRPVTQEELLKLVRDVSQQDMHAGPSTNSPAEVPCSTELSASTHGGCDQCIA